MQVFYDNIDKIEIPRSMRIDHDGKACLVIFVDASGLAMAAAAYVVVETQDKKRFSNLLTSRSKLCAIQGSDTIPRMELASCVIGTELATAICRCYGWSLEDVIYFSDSMTALWWLQSTQLMTPYVGSRVMRIMERSVPDQWRHIPTDQNPSDLPTRGMTAAELASSRLWWRGPEFLTDDLLNWPKRPEIMQTADAAAETRTMEEICRQIAFRATSTDSRRSKRAYQMLMFVREANGLKKGHRLLTAFLSVLRRLMPGCLPEISHDDMLKALIGTAQTEFFGDAVAKVKEGRRLDDSEPKLKNLDLYVDKDGLLHLKRTSPSGKAVIYT